MTPTGDPEFDRRFAVHCRDEAEMRAVLVEDVRRRLVALDRVGVTGVTVSPQGLMFCEPGLVTDPAYLREILDLLVAMAGGVRAVGAVSR
ncbi:MAG TPA: hypothetical protein VGL40_12365 [Bacillota bacterium]|jgi:hypothetical protein